MTGIMIRLLALGVMIAVWTVQPVHGAGVVGNGTPASCTEAALTSALTGGGTVTFNCGGAHTITVSSEKTITADTVIDGGGQITLSGGGSTRVLNIQNGAEVTLRHLTIADGNSGSTDGGGVFAERLSTLTIEDCTFRGNVAFNGGGLATNGWGAQDDGVVVTIRDSTFTQNTATGPGLAGGGHGGGGVYLSGGSAGTVENSFFSANQAANGGAIHLLHSNLLVTAVTFTNNIAQNNVGGGGGGAIYMDGTKSMSGEVRIVNATFDGNSTNQLGGAMFSFPEGSGATHIDGSTFVSNVSTNRGQGGAIYHQSATGNGALTIDNSTFVGNRAESGPLTSASQGGALWLLDAPVTITSSTFYQNDATHSQNDTMPADDWHRGFGGAIRTSDNTTIINSTLAYNTAGFVGGAIAGGATTRNTIVSQNSGDNPWDIQQNCTDELTNGGQNIQYPQRTTGNFNDYECFGGQTAVNPLLGTFGSYGGPTQTLPLQQGSPAIDAANNCPLTDQRGFARNGPCDIGAYEFGGGLVITTINPPFVGLGEGALTLTVSGVGFTATSVVQWDGVPRTTTYVNAETLTAAIPAADLDETGSFQVTVYDSERDLLSNAMTFRVVEQVYQIWLPMVRH
ncbi:MAG: hypothetical protein H6660_11045 [Ardenticatenaceae bacterium]|nr:hypothetical protein [Ardenticatenaceae bacterium]